MLKNLFTALAMAVVLVSSAAHGNQQGQPEFTEVASGSYKLQPKSAWLDAGMMPVDFSHVHYFVEVRVTRTLEPVRYDQPVKRRAAWEKIRKEVLEKMIAENYLTKNEVRSSGAPMELYRPKQWDYEMQQSLSYRIGSDVQFCEARLVVRAKKLSPSGDLRWMQEKVIDLSKGDGC